MFPEEDTKCFKKRLKLDPFVCQSQIISEVWGVKSMRFELICGFLSRFNRLHRNAK